MFPAVITSLETFDVRFPTSRHARRLRRDEPRPGLLRRVRGASAPTPGTGSRATGSRSRSGAATTCRSRRSARSSRSSSASRRRGDDRRRLAAARARLAAALARAREGRHAHGDLAPWSTRSGTSPPSARASRCGSCWRRCRPEELVELVDFRYLTDALTPRRGAGDPARAPSPAARERTAQLLARRLPGVHDDARLARLLRRRSSRGSASEAVAAGYTQIKLKVGADLDDDVRRLRIAREVCGPDIRIAVDANQRWDVGDGDRAGSSALAPYDPWWIEEPTSPDDVLGHAAIRRAVRPIRVATGEHVQNRVVFKQLMQAEAIDVVQIDAAPGRRASTRTSRSCCWPRSSGCPVCPHAGGVGLCELVQHLSMFDYVAVSGSARGPRDRVRRPPARALRRPGRDPATAATARPTAPGFSAEMTADALAAHRFPDGAVWTEPAMQS